MARRGGRNGLFTYDFGVAIAQGTVLRIGKMTSAVTALAGAMYFLNRSATAYVKTLRENTMQFGSIYNAIQKMQEAQTRIVKGQTAFSVDDQMKGMNMLMSIGLDAEKQFEFVNKAAHAMGQSFSGFSGAIAAGINGDMSALVQMGLITQRSAKRFDIYHAGTVQRQQAIMEFLQSHQGVANAIKNDFRTVNDSISQLGGTFKQFILDIIGDPKNPNSLYAKAVAGIDYIAEAFKRNINMIRQWGERIGEVLGWTIKSFGQFVVYLGKQFNRFFGLAERSAKTFAEGTKSLIVSLEFLKRRVKGVFDTVFDWMVEHKNFLKWLAITFAGIFAVTTVTRWVGAVIGALSMLNPYVLALTGLITGLLFALDRLDAYTEKKKALTAIEVSSLAGSSPKDIEEMLRLIDKEGGAKDKGGLTTPIAANLAMQLMAKRHGLGKETAALMSKSYWEKVGGKTSKNVSIALFRELENVKKQGDKLGYYLKESPRGHVPGFIFRKEGEEFPTGVTPLIEKGGYVKAKEDGTTSVKKSVDEAKSMSEKMLPTMEQILETMGVAENDSIQLRKAMENGFSAVTDKLSYIGGNTYNANIKVEGEDADRWVDQANNWINKRKREDKMQHPTWMLYERSGASSQEGTT